MSFEKFVLCVDDWMMWVWGMVFYNCLYEKVFEWVGVGDIVYCDLLYSYS